MSYICNNCGNQLDFYCESSGTSNFTCTEYIDGENEEVVESDNYDHYDWDVHDQGDVLCDGCGHIAEWISDEQWGGIHTGNLPFESIVEKNKREAKENKRQSMEF